MTVLYRLDATASQAARAFGALAGEDPWAGGHIAPGSFAPVITAGREFIAGPRPEGRATLRLIPRVWGVPPPPSVANAARPILSVRNPDSPFWIGNLRNSEFRCLVPATAFMEWDRSKTAAGKRKHGWYALADQPIFAFAGVWKDSEVPTMALLTCEPNAAMRAAGRDWMPVILPARREAHDIWLRGSWTQASALIAPYSSSLMVERPRTC